MAFPRKIPLFSTLVLLSGVLGVACDTSPQLPPATDSNIVDTVTMYALRGTNVILPSGFDLPSNAALRTDLGAFDFAFDIDPSNNAIMYPAGALGLPKDPGSLQSTSLFDSLKTAPTDGYLDSAGVTIYPGLVFVVRSRPYFPGCELVGQLPRYGKFHVLSIDDNLRSVTLEALVNRNCGYRDLQVGLPTL